MKRVRILVRRAVCVLASASLVCALLPVSAFAAGPGESSSADAPGGESSGGGADTQTYDYTGTYSGVIEADGTQVSSSGSTYSTSDKDVNAALAQNAGTLTLSDTKLEKAGDDTDGDSCNFYGVNSILLSVNEDTSAIVSDSMLSATSEGSNGVFATDSATAYVNNVSISTSADNSRGLDATYDGTIVAANVSIATQGDHCAGIATDRGGGSVSATSSTITTQGEGSPILYSTGDVEVSGLAGTASGSQLIGMEGANTVLVNSSTLTSTITSKTASDPVADGVIVYQSTSGDADTSTGDTATLQIVDSTLASSIASGAMFYFTNTTADVVLQGSTLDFDTQAADLILAAGNDGSNNWGSAGSNGASVSVTAIGQQLVGTVAADTISSVTLYLADGSTWQGSTLVSENSSASSADETASPLCVNVDASSTWVVTQSCELSMLTVADGGSVLDASGNAVTVLDTSGATLVQGSSSVSVTVESYSTAYDESAEGTLATNLISRSAFDDTFATSTAFALGDETASGSADVSENVGTSGEDSSDDTTSDNTTSDDATQDTGQDDSTQSGDGDDGSASDDGTDDVDSSASTSALPLYYENVKLSATRYAYTGKKRTPGVIVTVNGGKLAEGTDYTVTYASGRKAIGSYAVTVTGTGAYTNSVTRTFSIVPARVTLKRVTSKGKRKLTVKWAKAAGGVRYQIAYRKSGSSTWKKVTVSASKRKSVLKKLKRGKKYSMKVRAYKRVNGTTYYGAWSKTRTAKVK